MYRDNQVTEALKNLRFISLICSCKLAIDLVRASILLSALTDLEVLWGMVLEGGGQEAKLSELGGMIMDASRSTTINNTHRNVT